MYRDLSLLLQATAVTAALTMSGCSSDKSTSDVAADAGCPAKEAGCPGQQAGCPAKDAGCPAASANAGTADLPATGLDADVQAWLTKGDYKTGSWKCEPAPHASRSPSPHGMNRICSNKTLSEHTAGEYPIGSAAVKELYDRAGQKVVGHAVYRKLTAGAGASFYWWENDGTETVANGNGDAGIAKTVCVGCHAGAGSNAEHSGHDFVYTQVK